MRSPRRIVGDLQPDARKRGLVANEDEKELGDRGIPRAKRGCLTDLESPISLDSNGPELMV
jgi:hypothetical protein